MNLQHHINAPSGTIFGEIDKCETMEDFRDSNLTQLDLCWVYDQYGPEYLRLSKWLGDNYPKLSKGKCSRAKFEERKARCKHLGVMLGKVRGWSVEWFDFKSFDSVQRYPNLKTRQTVKYKQI